MYSKEHEKKKKVICLFVCLYVCAGMCKILTEECAKVPSVNYKEYCICKVQR